MSRSQYSYDQIKDLVVSSEAQGSTMYVQFALPGSDEVFDASAPIRKTRSSGVGSQVKRQVSRQVMNQVRRSASGLLRSVFGRGFLGRTASQTFNTVSRQTSTNIMNAPSKEDKENAIVAAFNAVAGNFSFDGSSWSAAGSGGASGGSVSASPSELQALLERNPVDSKFEKNVLARILAQVAAADGDLSEEEADFFASSIPAEFGTIKELAGGDPVSKIEAEEISSGTRETIYALAWTISSIDMDVSGTEEKVLQEIGNMFGFDEGKAASLALVAKKHVMEGYLHEDISRSELFELAGKLGMSEEDAERAKIAWMKRQ